MNKYEYELKRSNRKSISVEISREGKIIVRAPLRMKVSDIAAFLESKSNWIDAHLASVKNSLSSSLRKLTDEEKEELRKNARIVISARVKYFANIMGVTPSNVSINQAKTRFGSCNSKKRLNFSCNVMRYPNEAIDYVIVHELAHIKELNHSKRFWAIVESVLPDYKERQRILKTR